MNRYFFFLIVHLIIMRHSVDAFIFSENIPGYSIFELQKGESNIWGIGLGVTALKGDYILNATRIPGSNDLLSLYQFNDYQFVDYSRNYDKKETIDGGAVNLNVTWSIPLYLPLMARLGAGIYSKRSVDVYRDQVDASFGYTRAVVKYKLNVLGGLSLKLFHFMAISYAYHSSIGNVLNLDIYWKMPKHSPPRPRDIDEESDDGEDEFDVFLR